LDSHQYHQRAHWQRLSQRGLDWQRNSYTYGNTYVDTERYSYAEAAAHASATAVIIAR
jgi:hypothetical protein